MRILKSTKNNGNEEEHPFIAFFVFLFTFIIFLSTVFFGIMKKNPELILSVLCLEVGILTFIIFVVYKKIDFTLTLFKYILFYPSSGFLFGIGVVGCFLAFDIEDFFGAKLYFLYFIVVAIFIGAIPIINLKYKFLSIIPVSIKPFNLSTDQEKISALAATIIYTFFSYAHLLQSALPLNLVSIAEEGFLKDIFSLLNSQSFWAPIALGSLIARVGIEFIIYFGNIKINGGKHFQQKEELKGQDH